MITGPDKERIPNRTLFMYENGFTLSALPFNLCIVLTKGYNCGGQILYCGKGPLCTQGILLYNMFLGVELGLWND